MAMPNWNPGVQKGKKVAVQYVVPIKFSIAKYQGPSSDDILRGEDYYNKGVVSFENGNYAKALKHFNLALENNENDLEALYNRAICRFKLGDKQGACSDWLSLIQKGDSEAQNLLKQYCE